MGLVNGRNWIYTIHIFLIGPLLLYISAGYLFDMKLNEQFYTFAMWSLFAFSIVMLGYHGYKLRQNY